MLAPNANFGEATVMTLNKLRPKIHDNVTGHTALMRRLKKKGKMGTEDGGREIQHDIEYAHNGTVKRYSGYELLDISPQEVFTAVTFPWRQAAVAVTMSGLEGLINSGNSARYKQWGKRIDNAVKSITNTIALDVYSDGTADGGKQIGGLQLLIPDNPLNVVGGIDANNWDFWRNTVYSFGANGVTPGANRIQAAMNATYLNTTRGSDTVDLIVCDNTYYTYYWESLQQIQRITSSDGSAQAGFASLKFMGADVMFDGGVWGYAPPGMYFLNTDYLYFSTHKDRDFVPLDKQGSVNQDAMSQLIAWAGNMCITNRKLQGRIVD